MLIVEDHFIDDHRFSISKMAGKRESVQISALVVTGGTDVDIDDVRVITNKSKGKFGVEVANALAVQLGVQVTLLAAERTISQKGWISSSISETLSFRTFDDLYNSLEGLICGSTKREMEERWNRDETEK